MDTRPICDDAVSVVITRDIEGCWRMRFHTKHGHSSMTMSIDPEDVLVELDAFLFQHDAGNWAHHEQETP